MKLLDLDMDYFMENIAIGITESREERLSEDEYGYCVWSEQRIRSFLEDNLGLSKDRKIKGRIVTGHNEALFFWQELITKEILETPFEVVHIDSHADLGLGYLSWTYILDEEKFIWDKPVENTIQLVCNPDMEFPSHDADKQEKQAYLKNAVKEPEVSLLIIPSI